MDILKLRQKYDLQNQYNVLVDSYKQIEYSWNNKFDLTSLQHSEYNLVVLAGMGGAYLSIIYRPSWTQGMTSGMGWIVIALTIFSLWHPLMAILGSYIFGSLFYLSFRLQPWVAPELLTIMPYLFTILAPMFLNIHRTLRRRMGAPAALGIPYSREEE